MRKVNKKQNDNNKNFHSEGNIINTTFDLIQYRELRSTAYSTGHIPEVFDFKKGDIIFSNANYVGVFNNINVFVKNPTNYTEDAHKELFGKLRFIGFCSKDINIDITMSIDHIIVPVVSSGIVSLSDVSTIKNENSILDKIYMSLDHPQPKDFNEIIKPKMTTQSPIDDYIYNQFKEFYDIINNNAVKSYQDFSKKISEKSYLVNFLGNLYAPFIRDNYSEGKKNIPIFDVKEPSAEIFNEKFGVKFVDVIKQAIGDSEKRLIGRKRDNNYLII